MNKKEMIDKIGFELFCKILICLPLLVLMFLIGLKSNIILNENYKYEYIDLNDNIGQTKYNCYNVLGKLVCKLNENTYIQVKRYREIGVD